MYSYSLRISVRNNRQKSAIASAYDPKYHSGTSGRDAPKRLCLVDTCKGMYNWHNQKDLVMAYLGSNVVVLGVCSRDLVGLPPMLIVCARTISYARIEQIRVATE